MPLQQSETTAWVAVTCRSCSWGTSCARRRSRSCWGRTRSHKHMGGRTCRSFWGRMRAASVHHSCRALCSADSRWALGLPITHSIELGGRATRVRVRDGAHPLCCRDQGVSSLPSCIFWFLTIFASCYTKFRGREDMWQERRDARKALADVDHVC